MPSGNFLYVIWLKRYGEKTRKKLIFWSKLLRLTVTLFYRILTLYVIVYWLHYYFLCCCYTNSQTVISCDLLLESGAGAVYCGSQRVQQLINSRAALLLISCCSPTVGLYACYIGLIPEAGGMATGYIATVLELI